MQLSLVLWYSIGKTGGEGWLLKIVVLDAAALDPGDLSLIHI